MQQAQQLSRQRKSFWSGKNRPGEADKLNIIAVVNTNRWLASDQRGIRSLITDDQGSFNKNIS